MGEVSETPTLWKKYINIIVFANVIKLVWKKFANVIKLVWKKSNIKLFNKLKQKNQSQIEADFAI